MVKLLGGRGASAIIGFIMLALGSSVASAQDPTSYNRTPLNVTAAVKALDANVTTKVLGQAVTAFTNAVPTAIAAWPAAAPASVLGAPLEQEAAWLHRNGWPLSALVDRYAGNAPLDEQTNCLATAVFFEARGETLAGQLAVAKVVMNRAASGRYPPSYCATVKQPAQFSFVRAGRFPPVDTNCAAWRKATAIARLALANAVPTIGSDVLWYHADYVAPSWGRRLNKVSKIGVHIFYSA